MNEGNCLIMRKETKTPLYVHVQGRLRNGRGHGNKRRTSFNTRYTLRRRRAPPPGFATARSPKGSHASAHPHLGGLG